MRHSSVLVFVSLMLVAGAQGQQPQSQQPQAQAPGGAQSKAQQVQAAMELYQIDLNPSGSGFAVTKPVLEGDVYVFQVWPDRSTVRLPKARVKGMTNRTKDIGSEVVYRIDLVPSGKMFSRDNPTLNGTTYTFHAWKGGSLMSLRQADVKSVTRLTGLDAFRVHLEQLGAKQIGNLPMQGGGSVEVIGGAPASAGQGSGGQGSAGQSAPTSADLPPGNWIYQGVPGVTDAWAPASATVAAPGDVPRAPEHHD